MFYVKYTVKTVYVYYRNTKPSDASCGYIDSVKFVGIKESPLKKILTFYEK